MENKTRKSLRTFSTSANTSLKVGKSRNFHARARGSGLIVCGKKTKRGYNGRNRTARKLTTRQRKFLELKINSQMCLPSAKAARLAGYSESVAQKADRIIVRGSALVSRILRRFKESLP